VIVEPDFLDHWKTRLLVKLTGDESAPLMLLRLWAHCQYRKEWRFIGLTGDTLSAICRSKIDGDQLFNILNQSGFIESNGKVTVIHDWHISNRVLVSAWKNGLFGGRPKTTNRKPTGNRAETARKPGDQSNQSINQSKEEESEKKPNLVPTAEDIYNQYPRKREKRAAIKAIYAAIKRGNGASYLLERTVAYAATQIPNDRFTPYPATWFNKDGFTDDPVLWKSEPKKSGPDYSKMDDDMLQRLRQQLKNSIGNWRKGDPNYDCNIPKLTAIKEELIKRGKKHLYYTTTY
jgi:hypothetical protein